MKKEKIDEVIGWIDDSFIDEAMPTENVKKKKPNFRHILAFAAGFLIAIGIGAGSVAWQNRPLPDLSGKYEAKYVAKTEDVIRSATTISSFSGYTYSSEFYNRVGDIPEDYASELIASGKLPGQTDETTSEFEFYKIKNISKEYAIAARTAEGKSFSVLTNAVYLPETVGEWKENIAFEKTAKIKSVRYSFIGDDGESRTVEFENADDSLIYSAIFGGGKAKISHFSGKPSDICITIIMDIPSLATENYAVRISTSGYVYAKMPERVGTYRISKNAVRNLIEYFAENCEGKELIYR